MPKLQKFKKKTDKVNIKNLLISFEIILLGLTILGVYKTFAIYKIDKEYDLIVSKIGDFRGKNQVISYYINNQESDVIPEDKNYEVYVTCDNANGSWDYNNWKLNIKDATEYKVNCEINFREKYVLASAKSTNNSIIANYSNIENISSNYYLYGTEKNNLNQKSSDITNLNSDTTYYFKKCYEDNNEEICSDVSSLLTAGKVTNFDYTGGEQTYTTTCNGTYKLETWGAQGGTVKDENSNNYIGGYGGYSYGQVNLTNEKIYIQVGGMGIESTSGIAVGGFNGGGKGYGTTTCYQPRHGASGGGATHIASVSGNLYSLNASLNKVYIISGGGGGAYYSVHAYGNGSNSGGYISNISTWVNVMHTLYTQPTGGSQITGGQPGFSYSAELGVYGDSGSFGKGGNFNGWNCNEGSGGGAGLYGGGAGSFAPGAGGSSYIGNPSLTDKVMYCYNCEESNEESTKTISTTCTSETPTENCSKQGNGYARITIEECSI